jgi:CheY-like chemotaxis protein
MTRDDTMPIIIVDDDRFNLLLIAGVLETLGHPLFTFDNARQAMEETFSAAPALVVTDYIMPGMDGLDFVRALRGQPNWGEVPVLMITEADEKSVRIGAYEVGVTDFATKPIDPIELLARARALLHLGTAQAELRRHARRLAGEVETATASLAVQERERARLQQQLVAIERFKGVAQLASGIAHDFNNLLTVIAAGAESIEVEAPENAQIETEIRSILGAVTRGAELTQQMLAYSRQQVLKPIVFDATAEIRRNALMLERAAGEKARLELDLHDGALPLRADRTQFLTALINLVANARDACLRDARIVVRTSPEESDSPAHPVVLVEVEDNGSGMTDDVAAQVFEPFFSTKPRGQGTGLGLSMVHGFVHQSGGSIRLRTAPGEGSRLSLIFPLHQGAAPDEGPQEEFLAAPTPSGELRVLIVDDNEALREGLTRALQVRGFIVRAATDADAALGVLESARFDALLTDVVMAGSLDGLELARRVRQRDAVMPIVLITGFAGTDIPADLLEDPMVRVLRKPFQTALVSVALQELVAARRSLLAGAPMGNAVGAFSGRA